MVIRRFRLWAASPTRLGTWARGDVTIPRVLLSLKYLFLTFLGVAVVIASQPSIERVTDSKAWTTGWGYGLALFALVALIGSFSTSKAFEWLERVASVGVMSLFVVYSVAPLWIVITEGDLNRLSLAVVALALTIVPLARMLTLLRSTGSNLPVDEKPLDPRNPPVGAHA